MAVKEGQIPIGVTNRVLDTTVVTQTDGTLAHREAVTITDPATAAARVRVSGTEESATRYALQVQDDKMDDLISTMGLILKELQAMNLHLSSITDEVFDPQDAE